MTSCYDLIFLVTVRKRLLALSLLFLLSSSIRPTTAQGEEVEVAAESEECVVGEDSLCETVEEEEEEEEGLPSCRMCHHLIFDERCPHDGSDESDIWKEPIAQPSQPTLGTHHDRTILCFQIHNTHHSFSTNTRRRRSRRRTVARVAREFLVDRRVQPVDRIGCATRIRAFQGRRYPTRGWYLQLGRQSRHDRTSSNAWCLDECFHDPISQTVLQRIENLRSILGVSIALEV